MVSTYDIKTYSPDHLDVSDLAACLALIKTGAAVNTNSAAKELPRAIALATARTGEQIAGVGAIKRARLAYASRISTRSKFPFDPHMSELGYVAVASDHQGQKLSPRIVAALLSKHAGPLFATTDNERMKKTLVKAGFSQRGEEWKGSRGVLTLWIRD